MRFASSEVQKTMKLHAQQQRGATLMQSPQCSLQAPECRSQKIELRWQDRSFSWPRSAPKLFSPRQSREKYDFEALKRNCKRKMKGAKNEKHQQLICNFNLQKRIFRARLSSKSQS
jgi:hypothetical protein